jgi:hypothetical protein
VVRASICSRREEKVEIIKMKFKAQLV